MSKKHKFKKGDEVLVNTTVVEVGGAATKVSTTHWYNNERIIPAPAFETGEEVEAYDNTSKRWKKRIYLFSTPKWHYCVCAQDEHQYKKGGKITYVHGWKKIQTLKTPEIEITIKINGEEAKLSDISDETWNALKRAESCK